MDCLLEYHHGREPDDLHDQPAQFLPRKQSPINVHPIPEQIVSMQQSDVHLECDNFPEINDSVARPVMSCADETSLHRKHVFTFETRLR